jgi:hypothetical protein
MKACTSQRAREKWRELLDDVQADRESILIVRNKTAVAVMLSPERYCDLCANADVEAWDFDTGKGQQAVDATLRLALELGTLPTTPDDVARMEKLIADDPVEVSDERLERMKPKGTP